MDHKSAIVFGAGAFGSAVATTLYNEGVDVMIVDKNEELIQNISPHVTTAVVADITDEGVIHELGLNNFDVAVISIGSDLGAAILAAVEVVDAGIESVYAKAISGAQSHILKRLGVNNVIYPELDIGERLGKSIAGSSIVEYIHFSDEYSIVEIAPPKDWRNKSIGELDIRKAYNLNVIAILRNNKTIVSPLPDEKILEGDSILVVGEDQNIEDLYED